jgi:tetratricopeptide (TPR) repeat protein
MYGADHRETFAATGGLALLLERRGRFGEAEEYARHAAVLAEREFGKENAATARLQSNLGAVLLALGRLAEAEPILRRSLASLRRNGAPGDLDAGDMLNRLAFIALERKADDANALYREAVDFERSRKPGGPIFATDGYEYLGDAALRVGDTALAEGMYRRALDLYVRQLPDGHPYRVRATEGLRRTLDGRRPPA